MTRQVIRMLLVAMFIISPFDLCRAIAEEGKYLGRTEFATVEEAERHIAENRQKAIDKATATGYTTYFNGEEVGSPEALKRNQEYREQVKDVEYVDDEGATHTFIGQDGGYISKEQFIKEKEVITENMKTELGQHYKRVKESSSKDEIDREKKAVDEAEAMFDEGLTTDKEKVKRLKVKVQKSLISEKAGE